MSKPFTLFRTAMAAALVATLTLIQGCASDSSGQTSMAPTTPTASPTQGAANEGAMPTKQPTQMAKGDRVVSTLALPTGEKSSSMLLLERSAPAQVAVNTPFDYEYTLTNISRNTLSEVTLIEQAPDGFSMDSANPAATSSSGAKRTWALGKLAPGESTTVAVTGSASNVGSLYNCATATFMAHACLNVKVVKPELELVKKTGPNADQDTLTVLSCEMIPVRYTITNTGSGPATNVVLRDELPQGLTTRGGKSLVLTQVGDMAAGETKAFEVMLKAERTGTFNHEATVTADGGLTSADAIETVVVKPELAVTKTGPSREFINRRITYTVAVSNEGDGEARDAVLVDMLPDNAEFIEASGEPVVDLNAGTLTWDLGTLAPGAGDEFTVTIRPNDAGRFENNAEASAFCSDAAADSAVTNIEGIPAVLLEVVDINDPVEVVQTERYVITATNHGSAKDTNIRITVRLEPEQEFASASDATAGTHADGVVTFEPLPVLGVGAKATWEVEVTAAGAGDIRIAVEMDTDQLTRSVNETEATNFFE